MRTIRQLIDDKAEQDPEKTFLIAPEPNLHMSYGRLKEEAVNLGRHLLRLGLNRGEKISFMLGNGYQTAGIFLGTMYSGFVSAPLNLMAQPAQLEYVVDHSDTKLIFYSEDQEERLKNAVRNIKREILLVPVENDSRDLFPFDSGPSNIPLPEVDQEDVALLLYTSGTTGLPKGVLLSQKNMFAGGMNTAVAHGLTGIDRAVCSLPLYHINGEIVTVMGPLVSGGSVVMPHKFSVSAFWELISEYRCTWFSVVPTIISYLMNETSPEGKHYRPDRLRFGRSASSALPPSLHKAFEEKFKVPIIETMGLTETAAPVFSNPMEPSKRKYGSPGQAVGNTARIVGPEGKEVPRGVQGEIMIKGDNVMKGYYKAPELTSKAFDPDGWLHTGDLGYMDEDEFVFVTGRIKELIIKGGENIAPREIDEALYLHPAVLDAAAIGIPDEHYGEEILCCCVLKAGCRCTEQELHDHCRQHLGAFKSPKIIKIVQELPKGPSGKIQRLKLRHLLNLE